jgi:hypothetical protein
MTLYRLDHVGISHKHIQKQGEPEDTLHLRQLVTDIEPTLDTWLNKLLFIPIHSANHQHWPILELESDHTLKESGCPITITASPSTI